MSAINDPYYVKELPTWGNFFNSIGLSALVSGSLAAVQASTAAVFLPWALVAAVASVIDTLVRPIFSWVAEMCSLDKNGLEIQFLKTLTVVVLVSSGIIPLVSGLFGIAMETHVLTSVILGVIANRVGQNAQQKVSVYWLIPKTLIAWVWGRHFATPVTVS